jgi:hypothetical protein
MEAFIEFGQDRRKNLAQVMEQVAAFVGERRFFKEDFAGAPEAFECGFALGTECGVFGGCEPGLVAGGKQGVQGPMLVENGEAFGFGGVGGENGFDFDPGKDLSNGILSEPEFEQCLELVAPEAAFGGGALLFLAECADGCGGVFLHHVEELESDGVDESQLGGELLDVGAVAGSLICPREMGSEVGAAEVGEDIAEAVDEEAEVVVDFLETELEVIGGRCTGCGVSHAGALVCFFGGQCASPDSGKAGRLWIAVHVRSWEVWEATSHGDRKNDR